MLWILLKNQTPNKIPAKRLWVYLLWMETRLARFKRWIKKTKQTNLKKSLPCGDQTNIIKHKTWSSVLIKMGFSESCIYQCSAEAAPRKGRILFPPQFCRQEDSASASLQLSKQFFKSRIKAAALHLDQLQWHSAGGSFSPRYQWVVTVLFLSHHSPAGEGGLLSTAPLPPTLPQRFTQGLRDSHCISTAQLAHHCNPLNKPSPALPWGVSSHSHPKAVVFTSPLSLPMLSLPSAFKPTSFSAQNQPEIKANPPLRPFSPGWSLSSLPTQIILRFFDPSSQ